MARLLLADDHDLVRQTLAEFLQGTGVAQVSLASDVKTALALIAEFGPFDLALIDLHMSGMNGLAGFDEILSANQGRPVALISGGLSVDLARQALDAGAAGFVPKTLGAKALRAAVEAMLRGEVLPRSTCCQRTASRKRWCCHPAKTRCCACWRRANPTRPSPVLWACKR